MCFNAFMSRTSFQTLCGQNSEFVMTFNVFVQQEHQELKKVCLPRVVVFS